MRHVARLTTGTAMAVLLGVTATPMVQQLTNTADEQAHPRARAGIHLPQSQAQSQAQHGPQYPNPFKAQAPGRPLPWLTGAEPAGMLSPKPGPGKHHSKQELTGPKGTRVWVPSLLTDTGIPYAAAHAYHHAARVENTVDPACHIPWTLLAGIGRVESDHGQYGGSVLAADGISHPAILGVPLNGRGNVAAIPDTDNGVLDHDTVWDRAVGPMQFLPSTWRSWARDGDGDGVANPNDINDAALAAAAYLCASGNDVANPAQMRVAIYSYNQSSYYVALVMAFQRGYQTGVFVMPPAPQPPHKHSHRHAQGAHHHAKPGHHKKPGKHPGKRPTRHQAATLVQAAGRPTGGLSPVRSLSGSPTHRPTTASTKTKPAATTSPSSSTSSGSTPKPSGATSGGSSTPSTSSPSTSPSTSSSPSASSSPSGSPSASASPTLTTVTGVLSACGKDWCVEGVPLDLGPASQLAATAAHDLDGDGKLETNAEEVAGLALTGKSVTLLVAQGSGSDTVYTINGVDYRFADGTFA